MAVDWEIPLVQDKQGGAYGFPAPLDPATEGIKAKALGLEGETHIVEVLDNEVTFTDPVNGTKKLSELGGGAGSDIKVKISSNDTTTDYLENKLIGETNKITLTVLNEGGNEQIQITKGKDIADKNFTVAMAIALG